MKHLATVLALVFALTLPVLAKPRSWVEVRSPHFVVYTDGGVRDARNVAGQMERMRQLFGQVFPTLKLATAQPLEVVAVRNWKEFHAIEPALFLHGTAKDAGMFERGEFRDFILLRLDAMNGPYALSIVYHEYTHYIADRLPFELPVWLNEGLAEFYQTARISGSSAAIGYADPNNVEWLRSRRLIPLAQLFAVGPNSPYYHEEDKASIFYAESWALVHYLMFRDSRQHTRLLSDYLQRLSAGEKPSAAVAAFGDLAALQKDLIGFVHQLNIRYIQIKLRVAVNEKSFTAGAVSAANAAALEANVLAHGQRFKEALARANAVLQTDPTNAHAAEVRGFVAYRQGNFASARTWLTRAAATDPQDALAQVLLAQAIFQQSAGSPAAADLKSLLPHLQAAVRLRPDYAPGFNMLAEVEARQPGMLAKATADEARAIALEPNQYVYRWDAGTIQFNAGHLHQAIKAFQEALRRADSPARVQQCQRVIQQAQTQLQYQAAAAAAASTAPTDGFASPAGVSRFAVRPPPPSPPAPPETIYGTVLAEGCPSGDLGSLWLKVRPQGANSSPVRFSIGPHFSWNATIVPGHKFDPCRDMTGRPVVIQARADKMTRVRALMPKHPGRPPR